MFLLLERNTVYTASLKSMGRQANSDFHLYSLSLSIEWPYHSSTRWRKTAKLSAHHTEGRGCVLSIFLVFILVLLPNFVICFGFNICSCFRFEPIRSDVTSTLLWHSSLRISLLRFSNSELSTLIFLDPYFSSLFSQLSRWFYSTSIQRKTNLL